MSVINFDTKASVYEKKGLVQKLNADILLNLADLTRLGDVLDLGCGPAGAAAKIAGLTSGRVMGIELSADMIHIGITDAYITACRSIIENVFQSLANSYGIIDLAFKRIYMKAFKP